MVLKDKYINYTYTKLGFTRGTKKYFMPEICKKWNKNNNLNLNDFSLKKTHYLFGWICTTWKHLYKICGLLQGIEN